jgi:hypothetical protein
MEANKSILQPHTLRFKKWMKGKGECEPACENIDSQKVKSLTFLPKPLQSSKRVYSEWENLSLPALATTKTLWGNEG